MRQENSNVNSDIYKANFEQLFKNYYSPLYYYALHLISDTEICKDLVSDTFRYVWEHIGDIRMDTARVYMYTHLHRLCIDYLRHQNMKVEKEEVYISMLKEWNVNDWMESELRIKNIMRLIEEMPPLTRTVMQQCYVHKKKYAEVAALTGLSESGVRKHIMKGLDILRTFFSVKYKKR